MFGFPQPQHMPCEECGASVTRAEAAEHVCDRERWLDYQVVQRRQELDGFDAELSVYYASPEGQFSVWDAERRRAQSSDEPA
jgi:hypothetical protein